MAIPIIKSRTVGTERGTLIGTTLSASPGQERSPSLHDQGDGAPASNCAGRPATTALPTAWARQASASSNSTPLSAIHDRAALRTSRFC